MAIYKIFPIADATIYSAYPSMNTGLDEIVEASTTNEGFSDPNPQTSRFIVKFDQTEINSLLNSRIGTSSWASNLRLFIANAEGLTGTTTIESYPLSGSWNMGTGHYGDSPLTEDGVCWSYRNASGSVAWSTLSFSPYVTGSWSGSSSGGGNWYTGSSISGLNVRSTQSFTYYDDKDINVNVTDTIKAWYSGAIVNQGFLVKQLLEFSSTLNTTLKYFSRDTHTIYPPQLEFKWNDSVYNTGSLTVLNTVPAFVSIDQNPGTFYPNSINIFRVNSRPEYPTRTWQTSSLYTTNNALPEASYYAVKDLDTDEYVIDFDTTYTKLSCDSEGSFFKLYMNGLEPERYYKILIQTTVKGNTIIFDDNYMFKIVNG
jgi:hypothetical protein